MGGNYGLILKYKIIFRESILFFLFLMLARKLESERYGKCAFVLGIAKIAHFNDKVLPSGTLQILPNWYGLSCCLGKGASSAGKRIQNAAKGLFILFYFFGKILLNYHCSGMAGESQKSFISTQ